MIAAALAILLSFALGHAVLGLFWRPVARPAADFLLRSAFALGLGPGLCGLLFLLWITVAGSHTGWWLVELALVALLIFVAWRRAGRAQPEGGTLPALPRPRIIHALLGAIFLGTLGGALYLADSMAAGEPHGNWDAWAIWNLKARFMFRAPGSWTDMLQVTYAHADYPILLSTVVARAWSVIGREALEIPVLIAQVYLVASAAVLLASLAFGCGLVQGLLAATLLVAPPALLQLTAWQYSDLPFAFHLLTACAALVLYDRFERRYPQFLYLAGMAAGLGAWTKNEGLVLTASMLAVWGAIAWWQWGRQAALADVRRLTLVAAPLLILVLVYKAQAPAQNKLLAGAVSSEGTSKLFNGERHQYVCQAIAARTESLLFWLRGKYAWQFPPFLTLLGYGIFLGLNRTRLRASRYAVLLIFAAQALAYYVALVATPYVLQWHVTTALERLLLQLWPLFLLVYFLWIRNPEQIEHAPGA